MVTKVPTETQMGKVYKRLILNTLESNEDYIYGLIRVYNHEIWDIIDNDKRQIIKFYPWAYVNFRS